MSIHESDLVQGLSGPEVEELSALASHRSMSEGTVLFRLGEEADGVFVVEKGRVNLTLPVRLGENQGDIPVEERLPNQLLGWSGLIPPYVYTLQAVAAEDSELLFLPRDGLLELFSGKPEMGYRVVANLAATVGDRLQLFQTMWVREMQRSIGKRSA